jgi:hypothetical protein
MDDAKECPWCGRWCLKNQSCNYIFACGLDENGVFYKDYGCGRSWCFKCGKKFCGFYYINGIKNINAKDFHSTCCLMEKDFLQENYCSGGHDSHCNKRW